MFNMNELFIPTDYDLTTWIDVDNLLYKNKANFRYKNIALESSFYQQYFDFTEKSTTTLSYMNSNYSMIIDRIKLYLLSLDETNLDVVLDGDLKDWSILVDDKSMIINYRNDFESDTKSFKEKVYIYNLKEFSSELDKYKELKNAIDLYKNKYDQCIFMSYEKLVDTIERRLIAEEADKTEANRIVKEFKDDFDNNQNGRPDDDWKNIKCVIESYKQPMREIIEDNLYIIPYIKDTDTIDYSLLNDRLKSICLKNQNRF